MRTTIADLARAAGVSQSTVSRALNDRPEVDAATRRRITELALSMGYVANATAKVLRTGKSKGIGLAVPDLDWPGMLELIRGVASAVEETGYRLHLFPMSKGEPAERELVDEIIPSRPVDGLILIVPATMLRHIRSLARHGMPVVLIDDRVRHPGFPSVATTNAEGIDEVVRHLLALGRRRIAFLSGAQEWLCGAERLQGYRNAMQEAGLWDEDLVVPLPRFSVEDGVAGTRALLDADARFDAIVATSDRIAIGAMRELSDAGMHVPDDIAVTGFDDVEAPFAWPALTTVRQPLRDLGELAARQLFSALSGETVARRVVLPTRLVIRETCGVPITPARPGSDRTGKLQRPRTKGNHSHEQRTGSDYRE